MAIQSIDTAFVNAYKANIELQYQQMTSRARGLVTVETQNAERDFYDRIGPTDVVEITTRGADTIQVDVQYDRRAVTLRDFAWSALIDKQDRLRMLADPTSAYVRNAVAAMGRKMDSIICTAATGIAYSGKDGNTPVSFPNTGSYPTGPAGGNQQIAVDFVETGSAATSNLTVGKLRKALEIGKIQEAFEDGEPLSGLISASQLTSLLKTTEVTSSDFNNVKALVSGTVDSFLGVKFTRTQQTLKTGNNRSALIFPQRAITMAIAQDVEARVDLRPDKNYSAQVYVSASFNATRMWEAQVVEVLCDETK